MNGQTSDIVVGTVLSNASTYEAMCQLLEGAERGRIGLGKLLMIMGGHKRVLCRVAEITPYNAFYTEGDAWSEARRKGVSVPEEVARRYEICRVELLSEIPRGEVTNPPQPGDKLCELDPKQHEKEIFGVERESPKHVWYGTLSGYSDAPVPLDMEKAPMHIGIFGVTGSGKSFDTGALIERIVRIPATPKRQVSYPMIIIDAHGDYLDYAKYAAKGSPLGCEGWTRRFVFPTAYSAIKARKESLTEAIGLNLNMIQTRELAEMVMLFYKGTLEGADLQVAALDTLFDQMEAAGFASTQDVFEKHFDELLRAIDNIAAHEGTKAAIRRALNEFYTIERDHHLLSTQSQLKTEDFVDKITRQGGIAIIDFSADAAPGVSPKIKQFVMTYLASMLFDIFTKYKTKSEDRYLLFIIEEAQNFCPDRSYPIASTLSQIKLSAIATQGRKFGLSLCLISQRPSFVDRIVLSMCNTFLIHRISPEDVSFVKSVTGGLPPSLANRLTTLSTGELVLTGQMNVVSFPLLIRVPAKDRMIKPTVGETHVVDTLVHLREG